MLQRGVETRLSHRVLTWLRVRLLGGFGDQTEMPIRSCGDPVSDSLVMLGGLGVNEDVIRAERLQKR